MKEGGQPLFFSRTRHSSEGKVPCQKEEEPWEEREVVSGIKVAMRKTKKCRHVILI